MSYVKFLIIFFTLLTLYSCQSSTFEDQDATEDSTPPQLPPLKSFERKEIQKEILAPVPDFPSIPAGKARKQAFIDYLTPLIYYANQQILQDRAHLLATLEKAEPLNTNDQKWLSLLANRYKLTPFNPTLKSDQAKLKKRVDMIPIALALAQAANESAWGTSRFATQANNYFGQWCFTKGCGLVPIQRDSNATHEVKAYQHPLYAIQDYLKNLNSHNTYQQLRQIRFQARQKNKPLSSLDMADGLINYSARKSVYVKALQHMIRYNNLTRFNQMTISKQTQ